MLQKNRFPPQLHDRLQKRGYFALLPSERGKKSRAAFAALRGTTRITVEAAMQYLEEHRRS